MYKVHDDNVKTCRNCLEAKLLTDFPLNGFSSTGAQLYKPECRLCHNSIRKGERRENPDKAKARAAKWYREHPEEIQARRDRIAAKKYGITVDQVRMLQVQPCAICGVTVEQTGKLMAIDHCHSSGKVRGALCVGHNLALGGFQDNIEYLLKAIEYLKD